MSLIARLRAYAAEALGVGTQETVDETHLAATALLVHVARVDGILEKRRWIRAQEAAP